MAWLGDIPAHWKRKAAKHAFEIRLGKMLQSEPLSEGDIEIPYLKAQHVQWSGVTVNDMPTMWACRRELSRFGVSNGDLLVCEGGDVGRAAILEGIEQPAIIQNALHRVRSTGAADSRFLRYVLAHAASKGWFEILCNRATIAHFTSDKFGALDMPFPPPDEQRAIATFLDRETARIDALIEKKRRLVELLQEKRAAVITKAVTQGLDLSAAFQATGTAWFDTVPAHWGTRRLRYLTPNVTVGIVVTPSKYYEDAGVPALRSFNVKPGAIDAEGLAFISEASNQDLSKSQLREGDLVSVRTGNPGTTAVVPREFHGANCIDLIIIRRSAKFDSRYLCYFMNSAAARVQFEHGSGGALQQHFNIETAKDIVVPTPPMNEQIRIADHLELVTETVDRLLDLIGDAIARLSEFRSTLISAAVTGQVDVRGTA